MQKQPELTCEVGPTTSQLKPGESGWVGPRHCVGPHCLFSNRIFGGGIALATTSRNAQIVKRMVDDYEMPDEMRSTTSPSFYEAEIPGKGIGLIANQTIRSGEHIMSHTPTVMVQLLLHNTMPDGPRNKLYDEIMEALPSPKRTSFLNLVGSTVNEILDKNCFRLAIDGTNDEGAHLGCFEEVARFNHDCRPK